MRFSFRTEWPHLVLIAGMLGLAAASWSTAPDRIPVHWNVAGDVDRWGGRFEGLLSVPLLALGLYALLLFLPRIDPGRANYPAFASAFGTLRLALTAVLAAVYGVIQLWLRGVEIRTETWVPLILGVLFVVIGNVLGKVRPNWFVGIRTPWTLSSKLAWQKTHRAGRWVFIVIGLTFMALAVWHRPWSVSALLVVLFSGVIGLGTYSYVVWRRDPERVPPAGTLPAED